MSSYYTDVTNYSSPKGMWGNMIKYISKINWEGDYLSINGGEINWLTVW